MRSRPQKKSKTVRSVQLGLVVGELTGDVNVTGDTVNGVIHVLRGCTGDINIGGDSGSINVFGGLGSLGRIVVDGVSNASIERRDISDTLH